jgi:ferritin-like metal-binding protein YciE
MQFNSLKDVFEEQVGDLYSAEKQLIEALPKVAQAAHHDELRQAFETHLEQTRGHVERLEQIFGDLGIPTPTETCTAMEGLVKEGDEVVKATGDPAAKDAALIASAQRIEHYEIAGYGTARTLARELGHDDAASLLEKTLGEESHADELLTKIATGGMLRDGVNKEALSHG